MRYTIYQLQFDTPIHFGSTEEGGKLEQSDITYRADTLFSALCCEMAMLQDKTEMTCFHDAVQTGQFVLSDLFPYAYPDRLQQKEDDGGYWFYLPKPILTVEREEMAVHMGYAAFRNKTTQQKKQKKMPYIRISHMDTYLKSLKNGQTMVWDMPVFGQSDLLTRVNCSNDIPIPYYVNQFTFAAQAGLYGIIGYEKDEDKTRFMQLLQSIGLTGIGGKRSSGYGKFHFLDDPIDLDTQGICADDGALYRLLTCKNAAWYMNIGVLLPQQNEIYIVKQGQYKLCKRSGFLTPGDLDMKKRNDVYMIQAGSCFHATLSGNVVSLSKTETHPVWRNGKGFYVGLIV